MASRAREDYIKTIYELEKKIGIAKTTQLAEKIGVRAATVTEMIQKLAKETPRPITYKHHYGVHLTQIGKQQALNIIRRHRLLETFLYKTLGLNWNEVHEEAEVLEHHISHRVTEAIDRHLDFPVFDPHGEPIPDKTGNMASSSQLALSDLEEGCRFSILRVNPISEHFLERLDLYGIGIGTSGCIIAKNCSSDSLTVEIYRQQSTFKNTLSQNIADNIYVEKSKN